MHNNLKYLLLIRIIAMSGQVIALIFMHRFFGIDLPLGLIVVVFTTLCVFTLFSWLHLQKERELTERSFMIQQYCECELVQ